MTVIRLLTTFLFFLFPAFGFDLIREYKGETFFNDAQGNAVWDFFGNWDNLTLGDVWWVNQSTAFSDNLAYINDQNRAVLRVDNFTNVPYNQKRNSVRIATKDSYDVGSLWIADMTHVPYGCSVWPAFWSVGETWPDDGEIDIFEAINMQLNNQMALHTIGGCQHITPPGQTGFSNGLDCSTPSGCVVVETAQNSYQTGFAQAGGGVWATQFDLSGIYIWFWSRPNIPPSITAATSTSSIDISQWGPPSASFPNWNCDITDFFGPQYITFDITLCGDWAGVPAIYASTCANTGPTGNCYQDNVVGPGNNYDNAYFEVNYLRTYTTGAALSPTSTPVGTHPSSSASSTTLGSQPTNTFTSPNMATTNQISSGTISLIFVVSVIRLLL